MGGFVIASKMIQAGMGIQMLIGAGNFVIALIMMYGVIGIPMLMNTSGIVVTRHITPLSPWRGAGGMDVDYFDFSSQPGFCLMA